ncbi:very short patch repair endonuclease [Agrococcus jejuensis]|uniref:very short patch repair endonuclease n=1 Tax=Agrococcus jejuensis TaxID=399736 RepID=UPI00119E3389|nr:very short patch repair endonuclease [Agrococcus jejuensis]
MSWASSENSRRIMRANRRRDTSPEIAVRRLLHARGLRFRVDLQVEPTVRSRPDIFFTKQRVAIYIDGCFWHRCPTHGTEPKANSDYWKPKLDRNVERDRKSTEALEDLGWVVLRFWEHERPAAVADAISSVITRASGQAGRARSRPGSTPD